MNGRCTGLRRGIKVSSVTANAGNTVIAISMLSMNMKASSRPMSAWNLSGEKTQVATPTDSVIAVNTVAMPVSDSARRNDEIPLADPRE